MEAAFLCPLLQNTDEFGRLYLRQGKDDSRVGGGHGKGEEVELAAMSDEAEEEEEIEYDDEGNVKEREVLEPASEWEQGDQEDRKKKVSSNQR